MVVLTTSGARLGLLTHALTNSLRLRVSVRVRRVRVRVSVRARVDPAVSGYIEPCIDIGYG